MCRVSPLFPQSTLNPACMWPLICEEVKGRFWCLLAAHVATQEWVASQAIFFSKVFKKICEQDLIYVLDRDPVW